MKRILATGSRHWKDIGAIYTGLAMARHAIDPGRESEITLVHGGQVSRDTKTGLEYGADWLAQLVAGQFGWKVEVHEAMWSVHGRSAGPIRNREMVESGADIAAAFLILTHPCYGTRNAMDLCYRKRIPTIVITQ